MDALETELKALLLNKNDPESLAKLYLLLDSVRALADNIEAELDAEDESSSSSEEEDEEEVIEEEYDSDDSDISFTKEECKLIRDSEHRAFLKRYSIVPTERYSIVPNDKNQNKK
jgi:spore cortex formation protein SpoVR/YcgB (stage V sporulation)